MVEWTSRSGAARARPWALALAFVVLVVWQVSFSSFAGPGATDSAYRIGASGLFDNAKFVFFLRHLNLYPLATRAPIKADTREEAEEILRTKPESLVMDENWTFRSGDRGRTLLFLVDAVLKGRTQQVSVRPAGVFAWVLALFALLVAFSRAGAPALAICLVVALGGNVVATHEIYAAQSRFGSPNVFGWAFIALATLLALHGDLILDAKRRRGGWVLLIPIVAGVFLASVRTVRSEPATLLASCALVYAMQSWLPWSKRLALVAALVASFFLGNLGWNRFFHFKFDQVVAMLREVGGTPYTGPYVDNHELWHPVWCGLGDFDRTHGYVWDDRVAFSYALPILRDRYHVDVPSTDVHRYFIPGESWDGGGLYPKMFSELPHYHEVIRDKILGDIRGDPTWYLRILAQRLRRTLFHNAPVQLAWGRHRLQLPAVLGGWLLLGALGVCVYLCDSTGLALILFTLPLWATPLFIYSGNGVSSYASGSHSIAAAVLVGIAATRFARGQRSTDPA